MVKEVVKLKKKILVKNKIPLVKKKIVPVKKKITPVKKKITKVVYRDPIHVERAIIENFVAFQKVMTNLSLRFDNLSSQISKLLALFEASAKNLARKDFNVEKGNQDSKEILSQLNTLAGQNKIIARGLTLMHESNSRGIKKPIQAKKPIQNKSSSMTKSYSDSSEKTVPQNTQQGKIPQNIKGEKFSRLIFLILTLIQKKEI